MLNVFDCRQPMFDVVCPKPACHSGLDSSTLAWGEHRIAVAYFSAYYHTTTPKVFWLLQAKLYGGNEMGGDRIMSGDHQNGNVADNRARTNQTKPLPLRPLSERAKPAGKPFKPLRSPKNSR
jgi:hypothetical protein